MEQEQQQTNSSFEQIANEKINKVERITPVGELLKKSFRIFKQGASKFLSMTLLVPLLGMMPLVIVAVLFISSTHLSDGPIVLILQIILGFLALISILVLIYVFYISTIGVYILLRDFSLDLKVREAFRLARPYFWKLIVVNLFVGIFVLLWSLLFIIPGIIASVYYIFAIWTLIFEGYEGTSALKRSKELVKGYWWAVFGRYLAVGFIYSFITLIFIVLLFFVGEGSVLESVLSLIIQIIDIIIGVIFAIYSYLIYKDLVKIKGESQVEKKKGGKKIIIAVVILVLFVPVAIIALVSLNSARMIARDANRVSDVETIQTELEVHYYKYKGRYPIRLNDLIDLSSPISEDKLRDPQSDIEYKYTKRGLDDYELCFELEEDAGGYVQGENCVTSEDYENR